MVATIGKCSIWKQYFCTDAYQTCFDCRFEKPVSLQWKITPFTIALALCTLQRKEPANGQDLRCSFQFCAKSGDLYAWFEFVTEWGCTAQGIPVIKSSFPAHVIDHPSQPGAGRQELTLMLENVSGEPGWWFEYTQRWDREQQGEGAAKLADQPLLENIFRYIPAISHDGNTEVND